MQRRHFAMSILAGGSLLTAGCGGGGGDPASVAPAPAPAPGGDFQAAAFVYVANPDSASVAVYGFGADGAWKALSTAQAEAFLNFFAVHPSGQFAYATNTAADSISLFERDPAAGSLRRIESLPTRVRPRRMRFHPSGESAFVFSGGIASYSIKDGVLQEEGFVAMDGTVMDVHPSGEFLFVGGNGLNQHLSFRIDGTSLVEVNAVTGIGLPAEFAVAPSGTFLYTGGRSDGRVVVHAIGTDGSIGAATSVAVDGYLQQVLIHPSGQFAYASTGDDELGRIAILDLDFETGTPTRRGFEELGSENSPLLAMR